MKPNNNHIIPEEMLSRYFANELSPDQRREVEKWANASEENHLHFITSKMIWIEIGGIPDEPAPSLNVDHAFEKVRARKEALNQSKDNSGFYAPFMRLVAIMVLTIGIGWIIYQYSAAGSMQEIVSGDQVMDRTLMDGTVVTMNERTRIQFPTKFKDTREVFLTGQAFFNVTRDSLKPFRIHMDELIVEVLGTSFNIDAQADADTVMIHVSSGKVKVSDQLSALILTAGMSASYYRSSGQLIKKEDGVVDIDYWRSNRLEFNSATLDQVIHSLNKISDKHFILENQDLSNCRISVMFTDESLEEIIQVISATLNVEFVENNHAILISGEGC